MLAKGVVNQTTFGAYTSLQAQQESHSFSHTSHINTCNSCNSVTLEAEQYEQAEQYGSKQAAVAELQELHVNIYDREEEDKDSQQAEQYVTSELPPPEPPQFGNAVPDPPKSCRNCGRRPRTGWRWVAALERHECTQCHEIFYG